MTANGKYEPISPSQINKVSSKGSGINIIVMLVEDVSRFCLFFILTHNMPSKTAFSNFIGIFDFNVILNYPL